MHDIGLVAACADRVILLAAGQVVLLWTAKQPDILLAHCGSFARDRYAFHQPGNG